jgi:hypothetical protein
MLGVHPTPFEAGLKETWRAYLRQARRAQPDFAFEDRLLSMAPAKMAPAG